MGEIRVSTVSYAYLYVTTGRSKICQGLVSLKYIPVGSPCSISCRVASPASLQIDNSYPYVQSPFTARPRPQEKH